MVEMKMEDLFDISEERLKELWSKMINILLFAEKIRTTPKKIFERLVNIADNKTEAFLLGYLYKELTDNLDKYVESNED